MPKPPLQEIPGSGPAYFQADRQTGRQQPRHLFAHQSAYRTEPALRKDRGTGVARNPVKDVHAARSFEFHDYVIHGQTVTGTDIDPADNRLSLGTKDVFHLHRLHGAK